MTSLLEKVRLLEEQGVTGWKPVLDQDGIWQNKLGQVREFVGSRGEFPSQVAEGKEKRLGGWCNLQRNLKRFGKLSAERQEMLEAIPGWWWDIDFDGVWRGKLGRLKGFVGLKGGFPSNRSENKGEERLANWCLNQRRLKRLGRLSVERQRMLETVPGWEWKVDLERKWEKRCGRLKEFVKVRSFLPSNYSENKEEKRLGRWCENQRSFKRLGKLSAERQRMLEAVPGWWWDIGLDGAWQGKLGQLKEFVKAKGVLPYRRSENKEEERLERWCENQRCLKRLGKLSAERQRMLEAVPEWKWGMSFGEVWQGKLGQLKGFVKAKGVLPYRRSENEKEKRLGRWCDIQRREKRREKLSVERQRMLKSIPGWWWEGRLN